MRLRAEISAAGKNAAGVVIPEEVVTGLGGGRRPPVRVRLNGYTFRTSIGSMGGTFMLPISAETREGARVAAGDKVELTIELDDQLREVAVPTDLASALRKDGAARRAFESLSYSNKRRVVEPVDVIKSREARQRRIERTVERLREGKA